MTTEVTYDDDTITIAERQEAGSKALGVLTQLVYAALCCGLLMDVWHRGQWRHPSLDADWLVDALMALLFLVSLILAPFSIRNTLGYKPTVWRFSHDRIDYSGGYSWRPVEKTFDGTEVIAIKTQVRRSGLPDYFRIRLELSKAGTVEFPWSPNKARHDDLVMRLMDMFPAAKTHIAK
ncbi:hypothetical protein [Asticcacaulis sp. 201]|uniref:hypothetical protein n=1 Tax=Asticcacaulis sp. 201 TaxID=3028787 RepID=UPI0029170067|nr:hypothetical protein [Asticcacaulis sp. 201]MDV6330015.1 hypothetical protein [Asticcacaulis sp. 201]